MKLQYIKSLFKYNKGIEVIDFDFYRSFDILYNLTDNEIKKLHDYFINKNYKKGEMIFTENHPSAVLYIIKSGRVKLYMNFPNQEIIIKAVEAKKHFGETGIFMDVNRVTSAVAMIETDLIAIKKSDFIQFVKSNPGTGIKLLYNLAKSISGELVDSLKTMWGYETE